MSERPHDERDERIRLLEAQADFLRREVEVLTRRYNDIAYSAAWTIATPLKRVEDALHALVRRFRRPLAAPDVVPAADASRPAGGSDAAIAARLAAKMERPPAAG